MSQTLGAPVPQRISLVDKYILERSKINKLRSKQQMSQQELLPFGILSPILETLEKGATEFATCDSLHS